MSDLWGVLIVVAVLFAIALPGLLIAVVVLASRSARVAKLESTSERLERRVLELTSRVRQLEGGVAPSAPAASAPAPAPMPVDGAARPREHVRGDAAAAVPLAAPAAAASVSLPETGVARAGAAPSAGVSPPLPPVPPRTARPSGPSGPSAPRPPAPPAAPSVPIERVVGVLLTAGVGAVAFALAGLLFFHWAVKAGFIGPELRVIIGTLVGIAAVGGSVFLERRTPSAANALAAGGVVVLYAAFWASHVLYHLVPMEVAFVLMALVTAVTVLLADRRRSPLTAVLGILGGFATPILLTSGSNRPIELFTYVLALDAAFFWLAWRRRWAFLSVFALLGSVFLQWLWITTRMEPTQLFLALGITGTFAAVFAALGKLSDEKDRWQWGIAQAGGVLLPFGFALLLVAQVNLGDDLWPHALLLALLCAAAAWLGRAWRNPVLPLGAAGGAMVVLGTFAFAHRAAPPTGWEIVAIAIGLAAIFHFFSELEERGEAERRVGSPRGGRMADQGRIENEPSPAAAVPAAFAAAGFAFVLSLISFGRIGADPWPWIAGWTVLSAALLRQARSETSAPLSLLPAIGFPVALVSLYVTHHARAGFLPLSFLLLIGTCAAALLQVLAFLRRNPASRTMTEHAAALLPVVWLVSQPLLVEVGGGLTPAWRVPALALAAGLLAVLAATRLRSGVWFAVAVAALAFAHAFARAGGEPQPVFALLAASVVLVTAWPFFVSSAFRNGRIAWIASAFASAAWFLPLRHHYIAVFGDAAIGLLPLGLAALALASAFGTSAAFEKDSPVRRDVLALFSAVALGFVALAVPLQLDKQWITVAWALQGVAVIWLWTRLDHPGLKWFGLALLGAVTVRLTLNVAVPGYHDRGPIPVFNWILYTYWVPAVSLLVARSLLARFELERLREREKPLYPTGIGLGNVATSLAAIGVVFVWINLAIADWFAVGEEALWTWQREPGRDVAMSIAWALYGLVLLAIGMARKSVSLRWVSLAVLLLAIAKVFLYDLGELRDLYRVLSLLGLAFSLILVSFGYQRFVFRRDDGDESAGGPPTPSAGAGTPANRELESTS